MEEMQQSKEENLASTDFRPSFCGWCQKHSVFYNNSGQKISADFWFKKKSFTVIITVHALSYKDTDQSEAPLKSEVRLK